MQQAELERIAQSSSLPHRRVVQASALLLAADGLANEAIARACDTTADTVRRWRRKFEAGGVDAVGTIAAGRGRKPQIPAETIDAIVADTLHTVPDDGSTAWSTRTLGERHGVGKDTVARLWRARNLRPWEVATFELINDPDFERKVVHVVGLYVDPPEAAVVFAFDESALRQVVERPQSLLPIKAVRVPAMSHDDTRDGTVDLLTVMNIETPALPHEARDDRVGLDVLAFFEQIDELVDAELDIHVVFDNLSAHKSQSVRGWLAHEDRQRWHLHFTPTSASWLNLIEGWFSALPERR